MNNIFAGTSPSNSERDERKTELQKQKDMLKLLIMGKGGPNNNSD